MREISFEEIKEIQCDILYKIHTFCQNNSINYSLAYGTLLGSVRHKGYIPWDDDIDIMMLRPDYDKFILSFPGTYPELTLCAPEVNPDYYATYANVWDNRTKLKEKSNMNYKYDIHRGEDIGIKIDIFPVDALPNNGVKLFKLKYKLLAKLESQSTKPLLSHYKHGNILFKFTLFIIRIFAHIIGHRNIQKNIIKQNKRFDLHNVNKVNVLLYSYKDSDFSISTFNDYIDLPFEKYIFKAIANYDECLRASYGDYMKLPPIEKQIPHHDFVAYWKK